MRTINFTHLAMLAMLGTTTTAMPAMNANVNPNTDHSSFSFPSTHSQSSDYGTPDPRFKNHNITHPLAEVHIPHHKRDDAKVHGIYECDDQDFMGNCVWTQITSDKENKCLNRPIKTPFGSIGPDRGVYCDLFEWEDCRVSNSPSRVSDFTFPGTGDCMESWGDVGGPGLGACPRSYKCHIKA